MNNSSRATTRNGLGYNIYINNKHASRQNTMQGTSVMCNGRGHPMLKHYPLAPIIFKGSGIASAICSPQSSIQNSIAGRLLIRGNRPVRASLVLASSATGNAHHALGLPKALRTRRAESLTDATSGTPWYGSAGDVAACLWRGPAFFRNYANRRYTTFDTLAARRILQPACAPLLVPSHA